ncbi:MAG: hypothetical protein ACR2NN_13925 [Bryobacteraceae bacterium]
MGCGGTGSTIASGLPYLHQSMLATGHPGGLDVTLIDGDRISAANCVRQPFSESEIGLFKSVVLVRRLNLFWGLEWKGVPKHLDRSTWPVTFYRFHHRLRGLARRSGGDQRTDWAALDRRAILARHRQ